MKPKPMPDVTESKPNKVTKKPKKVFKSSMNPQDGFTMTPIAKRRQLAERLAGRDMR